MLPILQECPPCYWCQAEGEVTNDQLQIRNGARNGSLNIRKVVVVVGLGDELNAELKTTAQIFGDRSLLGKILANICIF